MRFVYNGKPVLPTKDSMDELNELGLGLYKAIEILEQGFELRKRKRNTIERVARKGSKLINVVVVDAGSYYKLIHAGQFSLNKKFKKLMRGEKNGFGKLKA